MRSKYLNTLKGMEREKVGITSNDMGRAATYSQLKKLVVPGITAGRYLDIHIHPLSCARQSRQKNPGIFFLEIWPELFSAQNLIDFGEHCKRKQNLSPSECPIQGLARLRFRQKQCTNEDVGIENGAQLCALQKGIQYLRSESPSLRFASDIVEHLLQRREFAGSQLAQPQAN